MGTTAIAGGRDAPRDQLGLELVLLDGFRLQRGMTPVEVCSTGQRLLAMLGLRGWTSRAVAAGTLWPEVSDRRAHGNLRTTLWRLGQQAVGAIDAHADGLGLDPAVRVDVRLVTARALSLIGGDEIDPDSVGTVPLVGELLPGWYDDWVLAEREHCRQLQLHALEALAVRLSDQGRFGEAIHSALAAVRLEPLRESAHRVVISVHLEEGNLAEAMRHYRTFRALLRTELDVEPSPRLTALVQDVPAPRSPQLVETRRRSHDIADDIPSSGRGR